MERSTSVAIASWKRRRLNRPGELVGHRLALDRLVQADVLDRDRGLLGEVVEELALGGGERRGRARATETTPDTRAWTSSPRRIGCDSAATPSTVASHGSPVSSTLRLGRAHGLLEPVDASRSSATCSSGALALGRTEARPGVGADAVDRGLDDDLQQALAIEVGGEGLADAAHRVLQARALLVELLQALLELARHLVELLAQRRELVVARVGTSIVKSPEPSRRAACRKESIWRCSERETSEREGEREDEEAGQDAAGEQAAVAHGGGLHRPGREHRDAVALAQEAGRVERGGVEALVADRRAPRGRRGSSRGRRPSQRRRQHGPADLLHDRPGAGDARDKPGVGRGLLHRDLQRAERPVARGRRGRARPGRSAVALPTSAIGRLPRAMTIARTRSWLEQLAQAAPAAPCGRSRAAPAPAPRRAPIFAPAALGAVAVLAVEVDRRAVGCAASRASALPLSLSAMSRKRTNATATIGTTTMRTKNSVSRLRKLIGVRRRTIAAYSAGRSTARPPATRTLATLGSRPGL